jgi:hypothetical protein
VCNRKESRTTSGETLRHRVRCWITVLAVLAAGRALADEPVDEAAPRATVTDRLESGDFTPWTVSARHVGKAVVATVQGGYDASFERVTFSTAVAATVFSGVTVHAQATQHPASEALQPSFGALVDVARQDRHHVDLAVGGEYAIRGWNGVPAVIARAAVGHSRGRVRIQATAALGFGLEEAELHGDLRASVMRRFTQRLWLGLDSRGRVDLERDDDEPPGEAEWEAQAGALATCALGRFVVSGLAGASSFKFRHDQIIRAGPSVSLGLGAVF